MPDTWDGHGKETARHGPALTSQTLSTVPACLTGETLYSTETTGSAKLPRHVRYSQVLPAVQTAQEVVLLAVQAVVLPATNHCSGDASWAKVSISESGSTNGHRYIKCSYDNCVSAFGTSDFSGKLDQVHVSAKSGNITVYSVCYILIDKYIKYFSSLTTTDNIDSKEAFRLIAGFQPNGSGLGVIDT